MAGFLAKAIATAVTFPVLKAQAMVQSSAEYQGSAIRAIRAVIKEGGGSILALWRGLTPKLLQAALQQVRCFQ